MERGQKYAPDTLSFADRISVNTNAVDWLLLLPNIGVEFDIRPEEWNRWTLGLKVRGNWQTSHTFKPAQVYNLIEAKMEARHYYRLRTSNKYFRTPGKRNYVARAYSNVRDSIVRHPNITYYHGGYLAFSNYSMKLLGSTGHQGNAISGGLLFGMVKPLYQFANGHSLDLDMGFSAGLCFTKADEYGYDSESNCYPLVEKAKGWQLVPFPVIDDVHVAFIYRFGDGKHMLTKKYRDRYDVDEVYRNAWHDRIDYEVAQRDSAAQADRHISSMQEDFDSIYNKVYPILLQKYKAEQAAEAAKQQHQREAVRQAEAQKKAAAAAQKAAQQAAKKAAADQKKAEKEAAKALKKSKGKESLPTDSVASESPVVSEDSVASESPEVPVASEAPEVPVASESPEVPVASEDPEVPEAPETPEASEAPVASEAPETSETPESSETPTTNDNPEGKEGEE